MLHDSRTLRSGVSFLFMMMCLAFFFTLSEFAEWLAVYVLSLLAMYSLSAVLDLFHLKKKRNADYIVVLGAGIIGDKVTPLLAARIEKGIELLRYNPNTVLIMSGGQGSGEDIPEKIIMEQKSVSTQENLRFSRELMNKQKPQIIIVTTYEKEL